MKWKASHLLWLRWVKNKTNSHSQDNVISSWSDTNYKGTLTFFGETKRELLSLFRMTFIFVINPLYEEHDSL